MNVTHICAEYQTTSGKQCKGIEMGLSASLLPSSIPAKGWFRLDYLSRFSWYSSNLIALCYSRFGIRHSGNEVAIHALHYVLTRLYALSILLSVSGSSGTWVGLGNSLREIERGGKISIVYVESENLALGGFT